MYELVTWPDVQLYMECDGFNEHSCLANDEYFFNDFGGSAYFIESEWMKKIDKEMTVNK